jgi:dolichyl-phosphate beta-glucosyltransferase
LAESLPRLCSYLNIRSVRFEIIVVDDGSDDNGATQRVAEANGCRFIANPQNLGKGGAVKNGILSAKGDYIIFTDADLPFGPQSIEHFWQVLRSTGSDVVVGDRTLADSKYLTEISWQRAVASRIFRLALGSDVIKDFPDTQCGLKGFSAAAAQGVFSAVQTKGFAFDVEVLCRARLLGLSSVRLPVRLENQGKSTVSLARHALRTLLELLRIRMMLRSERRGGAVQRSDTRKAA